MKSIIVKVVIIILYIIVIVCVFFLISTKFTFPGGFKTLVVRSGSMEPAIKLGSLVLIKQEQQYRVGDVITYVISNGKESITHRITEVKSENGKNSYITKGDANKGTDSGQVSESEIIGKVNYHLKYIGYLLEFIKTLPGLIILIIIPAIIIIIGEINNIRKEIRRKREAKVA